MPAILWLLLSLTVGAGDLYAIAFDRYHTQVEINAYMRELAAKHPQLVRFHALGYSEQGREINYVVIAKGDPETKLALYMNGTHHGNEKSSTESVLGLLEYLVTHRNSSDIAPLLESYAIYIQPLVNPDGHAANSRMDSGGRDPNRDYSFPERGEEHSFKSSEIRLVKELTDRVKFRAAIAWHSGMEAVLWPLGFTSQKAADYDTFYTLSKLSAEAMGVRQFQQSYLDYPTRGEFIDYMYMQHGTLALTFEVSQAGTPPVNQLAGVVRRAVAGGVTFMLGVMQLDEGTLELRKPPTANGPMTVATATPTTTGPRRVSE